MMIVALANVVIGDGGRVVCSLGVGNNEPVEALGHRGVDGIDEALQVKRVRGAVP